MLAWSYVPVGIAGYWAYVCLSPTSANTILCTIADSCRENLQGFLYQQGIFDDSAITHVSHNASQHSSYADLYWKNPLLHLPVPLPFPWANIKWACEAYTSAGMSKIWFKWCTRLAFRAGICTQWEWSCILAAVLCNCGRAKMACLPHLILNTDQCCCCEFSHCSCWFSELQLLSLDSVKGLQMCLQTMLSFLSLHASLYENPTILPSQRLASIVDCMGNKPFRVQYVNLYNASLNE